jgi:hypothetical protein
MSSMQRLTPRTIHQVDHSVVIIVTLHPSAPHPLIPILQPPTLVTTSESPLEVSLIKSRTAPERSVSVVKYNNERYPHHACSKRATHHPSHATIHISAKEKTDRQKARQSERKSQ